ncbi:MAG: acyl-CoA thioesterase [Planctomycetes bacterium]|nr:acyl-CoA thioesterase [Planctomycetota bacterium]
MLEPNPVDVHPALAGFPVIVQLPVCWGEMDSKGHVNNAVYFRYFESAHIEYFRRIDWLALERQSGIGPILAATQARFRKALTYPDTISVASRVASLEAQRFTFEHVIVSHSQGVVAAGGQGTVVAFHYVRQEKVPLPDEICRRIADLENRRENVW